jgi:hypothetical protein
MRPLRAGFEAGFWYISIRYDIIHFMPTPESDRDNSEKIDMSYIAWDIFEQVTLGNGGSEPVAGLSSLQFYIFGQVLAARDATKNRTWEETVAELKTRTIGDGPRAKRLRRIGITAEFLEMYE